jgi:hypothetical protein
LSDIREGRDAPAINDLATMSDSVISTNSAESTDVDINAIVEPLHGFEQPEVSGNSSKHSLCIRKKPDRLIESRKSCVSLSTTEAE